MRSCSAREVVEFGIHNFAGVVTNLGFKVKRDRAACLMCGATNQTTCKFNFERGTFYCFRCGARGGVLDLIEVTHGCDRAASLRWLAASHGVVLDRPTRRQGRQQNRHLRRVAVAEASLERLRRGITGLLRAVRNSTWSDCRRLDAWATKQGGFTDNPGWKEVAQVPDRMRIADGIGEYLHELENMSAHELIELRKRLNRRASCQKT